MSQVEKFEDLVVWQNSRKLAKEIYKVTQLRPWVNDIRFVQQIHASVGSVMDNIAEGFERGGNKEFLNFLYIAKGSCGEVRSQIIRAADVGYLDKDTAKRLYNDCQSISKSISALIKTIRTSGFKGEKYDSAHP